MTWPPSRYRPPMTSTGWAVLAAGVLAAATGSATFLRQESPGHLTSLTRRTRVNAAGPIWAYVVWGVGLVTVTASCLTVLPRDGFPAMLLLLLGSLAVGALLQTLVVRLLDRRAAGLRSR